MKKNDDKQQNFQRVVKIGLVQMRCAENKGKNLKAAISHIKKLAGDGAQIICLPELFLSKYFCQEKSDAHFKLAEEIPGPTTAAIGQAAKATKTVILCSIFEKTGSTFRPSRKKEASRMLPGSAIPKKRHFNSVAVIGTEGEIIGVYRKMHIPSIPPDLYAENYYFEKGDKGFCAFNTPYGKIAPMVCYDQWFPEGARVAAAKGAQILFYPTAVGWPLADRGWMQQAEHEAWQIIQRGHGIANNVFVVAANRVGVEKDLKFWGTSFVSDPYGRVIAKASSDKEENLTAECDLSLIGRMRQDWPFLDERRIKCEDKPL